MFIVITTDRRLSCDSVTCNDLKMATNVNNFTTTREHLFKVLVIGEFGVGKLYYKFIEYCLMFTVYIICAYSL